LGELQCDKLGKYLAKEKFTHVFTSDLTRTQQTAKHILKHNENKPSPEIIIDSRIRERDFGDWEGLDVQSIFDKALAQGTRMHRLSIPEGENYNEFSHKALDFFLDICKMAGKPNDGDNSSHILIASHGGWILTLFDSLVAHSERFTLENYAVDESIRSPGNSSFSRFSITKGLTENTFLIKFQTIFNTSHLQL